MYLLKLDASANFLYAGMFGGATSTFGRSVTTDATGNIYTTGFFTGTVDFAPHSPVFNLTATGGKNAFIQKIGPAVTNTAIYRQTLNINVYPNPTSKTVYISAEENINSIVVTDMLGKKVYEAMPGKMTTTINLSTPGIYFVTVSSVNNTNTQKVVVN
jgi:hypothetical protein